MPEPDNDRLEEFFRKAAIKADVPFNEEDWKKLEARLDAEDFHVAAAKVPNNKIAAAVAVGLVLLFSGAFWVNSLYSPRDIAKSATSIESAERNDDRLNNSIEGSKDNAEGLTDNNESLKDKDEELKDNDEGSKVTGERSAKNGVFTPSEPTSPADTRTPVTSEDTQPAISRIQQEPVETQKLPEVKNTIPLTGIEAKSDQEIDNAHKKISAESHGEVGNERINDRQGITLAPAEKEQLAIIPDVQTDESLPANIDTQSNREIITPSRADAEKTKQKADVELPGAEERETVEAEAMVEEEHASEKKKHVATPRLSLLLSFAPDFTSTSNRYSAPGKAFGAVIHYHLWERFSVSAGVIKNNKKYTGDGEDYTPPTGYWKNYTNGIVPYSIDGSCSVIEFPFMVQYTLANRGKHKWLLAAGTSSYLMMSESYRYNFEEPNPGAKEGWDSRGSSRFYFNMVNFTLGYEYQVLPGLMIGIEPYVKVPIEEIGWTNLKLFSTGASITMRYKIIGRKSIPAPNSRPPD